MSRTTSLRIGLKEKLFKVSPFDKSVLHFLRILPLLLLAAGFLVGCGLLGSKKKKKDHTLPGFIVFSAKDSTGHNELFRMKPDGSNIHQLTHLGRFGAFSPAISPDGKTIVFSTAKHYTTLGLSLYLINADGTHLRPLGKQYDPLSEDSMVVFGSDATWSPDGQKVAYDVCYQCEVGGLNQEIFVYDRKAKTVTRLTHNPAEDSDPSWSPDGRKVAFVSNRDYYQADTLRFRSDLYVMDSGGTNIHRLTTDGYVSSPIWETHGNTIIYGSYKAYKNVNYKLVFHNLKTERSIEFALPTSRISRPVASIPNNQQLLMVTVVPVLNLYLFDYKTNTVRKILDGYSNVIGISMYTKNK